jgi:hypothetical protein
VIQTQLPPSRLAQRSSRSYGAARSASTSGRSREELRAGPRRGRQAAELCGSVAGTAGSGSFRIIGSWRGANGVSDTGPCLRVEREAPDRVALAGLVDVGRQAVPVLVVGGDNGDRVARQVGPVVGGSQPCRGSASTRATATAGSPGWILASLANGLTAPGGIVPSASRGGSASSSSSSSMRSVTSRWLTASHSATPLRVSPASSLRRNALASATGSRPRGPCSRPAPARARASARRGRAP